MARVYNFSAGPSMMPESVLRKAAAEMLDYEGCGQSVMEMSHRSRIYGTIIEGCEAVLRELLGVPDNYKVMFLQGGASTQFAMVPLNFMITGKADYVVTGQWAKKAYQEGCKFGDAREAASSADRTFTYIPKLSPEILRPDADYVHVCYNNTIYGTHYNTLPDVGSLPLIADMSSCIMSEPVDVTRFAAIYAGAQKNIGPAGLVVAIVREDMLGKAREGTPTMLNYKTHADNGSMYNTPPAYSIYICKLILEWIRDEIGGLEKMNAVNRLKAGMFYDYLDGSRMFRGTVVREDRSLMNIPFVTGDEALDKKFVGAAEEAGFVNLKGHRTVGGMRASIYNAMPVEGVEKLIDFMRRFEKNN
mgnify:CR=1 FL=1